MMLTLLISATSGCVSDDMSSQGENGANDKSSESISVASSNPMSGSVEPLGLSAGESSEIGEPEPREAMLAIFKGGIEEGSRSVTFVRSIEADLYRDRDATPGSKQWVTRATIVDDSGRVLWRDRIYSMFQLLSFLQTAFSDIYSVTLSAQQIVSFAQATFPELLEFGVHIPLGLEGASEYVLEWRDDQGNFRELGRFELSKLVEEARPPRTETEVETLHETGPPSDRLDIAILSDGYTSTQREAFQNDARAVLERFRQTVPFDEEFEHVNVRTVWTPSNASGASYDCTGQQRSNDDADCNRFRETVFEFTFIVDALVDEYGLNAPSSASRLALPLQVARMHEVAASTPYDEIILLSNSDRRSGFAGMYSSVLTAFDDGTRFPDVAVHEFGHSFGLLGDEYYIPSDPCLRDPDVALPPNISATASYDQLKWNEWVDPDTPLPTPSDAGDPSYEVGAYQRAYNCKGLYRPSRRCKMRDSQRSFGAVCRQQLVRRVYDYIDPIPLGYPRIERRQEGRIRIEGLPDNQQSSYTVQWRLGGETLERGGPSLELSPREVDSSWQKLEMTVAATSPHLRDPGASSRETHTLWVRKQ